MLWIMLVGSVAGALPSLQQTDRSPPESTLVVLSPALVRPGDTTGHRGRGWRGLWADTLKLPVIDARTIGGGASRFEAEPEAVANIVTAWTTDSHAYRVAPVGHDPVSASIPRRLQGTSLEPVLQDLIVTVHPTAPLAASALYRAVGLYAVSPTLGVLSVGASAPSILRPLQGMPVWIERAPERDRQPYEDFRQVITTAQLLDRLSQDPTVKVARREYLAARLLDLVMGDRDRRPEHWLWGQRVSSDGKEEWVAIATRQEEAFLRAEGWSRLVLNQYEPGYQVFSADKFDVDDLAAAAYDLDRLLLPVLERAVWDSVSGTLGRALTDTAITTAIDRLPPPHRFASTLILLDGLEGRRAMLPRITDEFYRVVSAYPDIELTMASEQVTLRRAPGGDVELRVTAHGEPTLHRIFRKAETQELRLHLQGGNDTVHLEGVDHHGVGIRLTSTSGTVDVIRDAPSARRVVVYAARDAVHLEPPDAIRVVPRVRGRWRRWQTPISPPLPPDWGVSRSPIVHFNVSGDLGLLLGVGAQWTWRGFDQRDYRQRFTAAIDYASLPASGRLHLALERRDVLPSWHLFASMNLSGIEIVRFFGFGNNTSFTESSGFFRADARELALRTAVAFSSRPDFEVRVGPVFSVGSTDTTGTATLVAIESPYGTGNFNYAGLEASVSYTPVRMLLPDIRFSVTANAVAVPNWLNVDQGTFSTYGGEFRGLWTSHATSRLALATRLGGTIIQGTVPLRQAARIGGPLTLRGFDTDRFTGDRGAAYGSLEARMRTFRVNINFISADLGVLGFVDAGRVWTTGEESSTIHTGFGGGIWLAPTLGLLPAIGDITARLDIAFSRERTIVSAGTGFRF